MWHLPVQPWPPAVVRRTWLHSWGCWAPLDFGRASSFPGGFRWWVGWACTGSVSLRGRPRCILRRRCPHRGRSSTTGHSSGCPTAKPQQRRVYLNTLFRYKSTLKPPFLPFFSSLKIRIWTSKIYYYQSGLVQCYIKIQNVHFCVGLFITLATNFFRLKNLNLCLLIDILLPFESGYCELQYVQWILHDYVFRLTYQQGSHVYINFNVHVCLEACIELK